jgi:hypothetical protein
MNSANDILAYMSEVSSATSELSETNNVRELMAQAKETATLSKDQVKTQIGEFTGEFGVEGILGLAKTTLGTAVNTAKDLATNIIGQKTGISADTISKFASGDIEGGLKSLKNELGDKLKAELEKGPPEPSPEEEEEEQPPTQEEVLARASQTQRPQPTQEDLPEGAGSIEETPQPSIEEGIASDLEAQNQYQEMVNTDEAPVVNTDVEMKTITSNVAEDTGEDIGIEGGGALADVAPEAISAGIDVASEAIGGALDLTLGPVGLLVGFLGPLIGGLVSAKEEANHASDVANSLMQQAEALNPSSQFL